MIEPKLMRDDEFVSAREYADDGYLWSNRAARELLAHIAAQDLRIAELEDYIHAIHCMVDQTDPNDPIGVALTRAGLERKP